MRIAYFLADHGIPVFGDKGASVHVRSLCKALTDLGHEVVLFCTKRGPAPPDTPYEIRKIEGFGGDAECIDTETESRRQAKEQRYLRSAAALTDAFLQAHREAPFDAIYERYSLWSSAAIDAGQATGLPALVEINAPLLLEQRKYRQIALDADAGEIERKVFSGADALFAVSRAVADYVAGRGGNPADIEVLPNGIDPSLFHEEIEATPLPGTKGRTVIAFSGSLKAWHGVEILLDAYRELHRRIAGTHLLIVGDGPLRPWVEGYVAGADLSGRVTLTGWLDHSEVAPLLAAADIAVAPYPDLDDFYFSPLKLFEYLAMGKPVVASRIGQVEDLLTDRHDAILTPPGEVTALADALECLVVDDILRHRMGRAAARLGRRFTWHANARSVVERIERLRERKRERNS